MIVSNASSFPFPRIAEAADGRLWYQLYARRDIESNRQPLADGQEAGAQTVVVTIDQQASYYERDLHDRIGTFPSEFTDGSPITIVGDGEQKLSPACSGRLDAGSVFFDIKPRG